MKTLLLMLIGMKSAFWLKVVGVIERYRMQGGREDRRLSKVVVVVVYLTTLFSISDYIASISNQS
jgi:hypothetical protein